MTPKQRAFDALRGFAPLWGGRTDDPCDMVVQAASVAIADAVASESEACAKIMDKIAEKFHRMRSLAQDSVEGEWCQARETEAEDYAAAIRAGDP